MRGPSSVTLGVCAEMVFRGRPMTERALGRFRQAFTLPPEPAAA